MDALEENTSLTHLNLSVRAAPTQHCAGVECTNAAMLKGNPIGDEGALQVATLLTRDSCTIKSLCLDVRAAPCTVMVPPEHLLANKDGISGRGVSRRCIDLE